MQPRWWPRETRSGGGCPAGFRHCDTRSLPVGSEFRRASVWAASHAGRLPLLHSGPYGGSLVCARHRRAHRRRRSHRPAPRLRVAAPRRRLRHRRRLRRAAGLGPGDGHPSPVAADLRVARHRRRVHDGGRPDPGLPDPRRRRVARRDGLSPEPHALPVRHRALRGPHRADPDQLPRGRGRRGRPVHAARGPRPAVRPGCRDARDARRAAGPDRVLGGRLRRVPQHRSRCRRDRLRGQRSRRAMGGVRRRPGGMERRVGPRPGVLRRPAGHHHAAARTPVPGLLAAAVARERSRGGRASRPRPLRARRHVHGRPQPHPLPLPRPGRRTLPLRSGAAGRRRRARLLAERGTRDEHRPAGRLQPRLEAGSRLPRRGRRGARRQL